MRGREEKRCLGKGKHKIVWQDWQDFIFVVANNSDTVAMQDQIFEEAKDAIIL